MSLSQSEKFDHAARLTLRNAEDPEFCLVYEDEKLEGLSEEDQQAIHDLMRNAKIAVSFDGCPEIYGAVHAAY